MFFCDPPYWETEGYGVDFGIEHYLKMADMAKTIKGRMIITVNDHPKMHEVFAGLKVDLGSQKPKSSGELIIFNREDGWGGQERLI